MFVKLLPPVYCLYQCWEFYELCWLTHLFIHDRCGLYLLCSLLTTHPPLLHKQCKHASFCSSLQGAHNRGPIVQFSKLNMTGSVSSFCHLIRIPKISQFYPEPLLTLPAIPPNLSNWLLFFFKSNGFSSISPQKSIKNYTKVDNKGLAPGKLLSTAVRDVQSDRQCPSIGTRLHYLKAFWPLSIFVF